MSYTNGSQIIEEILERHKSVIGSDFAAYRGHALRIRAFALKLGWDQSDPLLQVAAATHDLAVWTHDTVDYLEPSGNLAAREAAERGFNRAEQNLQLPMPSGGQLIGSFGTIVMKKAAGSRS